METKEKHVILNYLAKEKLLSGDYDVIPAAITLEDLEYLISVFQLSITIMYYGKKYITKEQRGEGKYAKKNIWDYLCQIENYENKSYYNEVVEHRERLGFPLDERGNPEVSSSVLQRILSTEKQDEKARMIVQKFYNNQNFMKIYWEAQYSLARGEFDALTDMKDLKQETILETKVEQFLDNPKIINKLETIVGTANKKAFSRISGIKFKNKKEFKDWMRKNPDKYKDTIFKNKT